MRELRQGKKMSPEELATMVGISTHQLLEIEAGRKKINLYTWVEIMKHIDDEFDFMS